MHQFGMLEVCCDRRPESSPGDEVGEKGHKMNDTKKKHTHKYMKVTFSSGFTVFKCMWPDCAHYVREELAEGRESVCWRCQDIMVLNTANMTLKKPHHLLCTRKYNKRMLVAVDVGETPSFTCDIARQTGEN